MTEEVGSGEGEGTDSSEGAEGRREERLAKIQAMLDTTTVRSTTLSFSVSDSISMWFCVEGDGEPSTRMFSNEYILMIVCLRAMA